jgi:predicted metal-binding protein
MLQYRQSQLEKGEILVVKIGIIRCDENSERCAGWNCFPAIANKTGKFEGYDKIELVGFDTCGGCGHGKPDKILKNARRLKKHGAEVIHLGNCLAADCPSKGIYVKALKRIGIPIVERTHGGPSPEQMAKYKAMMEAKKAKAAAARKARKERAKAQAQK